MNVEKILEEAFFEEAKRQNLSIISVELTNLKKKFDIMAVQRAVDKDIERINREYREYPSLLKNEVEKRERYHRSNLKKLAQDYARLLATERVSYITESKASETRNMLKVTAAKPCDAYPC